MFWCTFYYIVCVNRCVTLKSWLSNILLKKITWKHSRSVQGAYSGLPYGRNCYSSLLVQNNMLFTIKKNKAGYLIKAICEGHSQDYE